jgi:Protein kinase domain/WD40-like Beta Propeller Repeat
MALPPGTRLGPYEVVAPLGAGGMGEVYRARDTKLGRDVALKVLPESFTHDPDRVARFNREAQVLASLNHPHIAAIYGLHEAGAIQFLVLELVDGDTLARHLAKGPMPLDEAIPLARQIAEALQAAHEKGITHRDLKPANIALTVNGQAKVLDFGLAKAREPAPGVELDLASSPTLTTPLGMTGVGVLLGTAAYMSPEQAKGRTADHRSDIWAFGCILYEMLTGRRLFGRETIAETLAAVLKEEPDLTRAPARARRLLQASLEKDPTQRLQAIGDSGLLLEEVTRGTPETASRVPWVVAAALAVVAALGLWAPWRSAVSTHAQPAIRLDLDLGAPVAPGNLGPDAILSPDGTRLVLVVRGPNGKSRLQTRRVDEPLAVELRGTEGAYAPFFSPDAQWVAFFAAGKLKKAPLANGDPVILCDAPAGRGGSWGDDGTIVATLETQKGLSRIASAGGPPVALTVLAPGENSHRWPQVLPGAKAVLFTSNKTYSNFDESTISAVSLADRRSKIVLERAGMHPRYVPSGHLTYVSKGTLYAVPFDPVRLEIHGRPAPVVEDVSNDTAFGFSRLDVSASGILLYRRGRTEGQRTIYWLDGGGRLESLDVEPAVYQFLRISPDGSRLIWMMNQGPSADLWVYEWRRGSKTRLTDGQDVYAYPVWSPDGRYVVFSSSKGIFWTRPDGAGRPHPLIESKALLWPTSFTPDGKRLVYSELNPTGGLIKTVLLDGSGGQLRAGTSEGFLQTSALPFPAFSPDGRWLAYADAESGRYEVYVRAFPDKGTRWLISSGGGTMPLWSRTERELFYRDEDSRIMVATYTANGDTFVADKPRVWSEKRLANTGLTPLFDLAPDGKRFAVLVAEEGREPPAVQNHVTLILNFFDELRRRVPQGNN